MPRNTKGYGAPRKPGEAFKSLSRIVKMLRESFPKLLPLTLVCILFSSAASSIPAVFMQKVIADIETYAPTGNWEAAKAVIFPKVGVLIALYVIALISMTTWQQIVAVMTHSYLHRMRCALFDRMQNLPIRYFDTHQHGDIMSHYTNDIDTIRQMISQALPALVQAGSIVVFVFCIMLYYSFWLTLVVVAGIALMTFISKTLGGGSAKYFIRQQAAVGKTEGYVQEMMTGQKVVQVFCHEAQNQEDFDAINEQLYEDSYRAHAYANALAPIILNLGNLLYVLLAIVGGALYLAGAKNISFSGKPFQVSILVPFLNMAKQFTGNLNQVTQQLNAIVMAVAGAERVFALMDEEPEADNGYVTMVNVRENPDGSISESSEITHKWAWKHPHSADGSITYTPLQGDVTLDSVDFAYEEGKPVLQDVTVFAKPGQKVAFVGATGAGKTTITNLINRFYDIADGKIRYDGININKIKKSDLRRSLGIVLQETNLFTGTVMDNIRYGRLDASDEDCIAAAKLAGADDFITRLPEGYATMLSGNGANLSQGQRQLLAIARAAVADPPVMILDEATSSIDTRTEAIVQRGMDALMKGRTVFVIAHRLSTVRNSDVIMVLDHGKIIERGSHEALLEKKGTYYQLYTGAFELD
ncbi:MAG: ABC transporter ATP-binding protein/permease [Oscillospiraceae bacterium]|nr:ABC transporter ATP-binding protein/permease [Oscillospiraceae bacterium]